MPLAVKSSALLLQNGGLKECCCAPGCNNIPCDAIKQTLTLTIHSITPSSYVNPFGETINFSSLVTSYVLNYDAAASTQVPIYKYVGPCTRPGDNEISCARTVITVSGPLGRVSQPPPCLSSVGLDFPAGLFVTYQNNSPCEISVFTPRLARLRILTSAGSSRNFGANGFNSCTSQPVYTRDVSQSVAGVPAGTSLQMQAATFCFSSTIVSPVDFRMTASITI